MKNKLLNIFTNIVIMVIFLLTYFLDLTGLDLHQYLGMAVGILLIVHIATHAVWIKQVSAHFFSKISRRVRFYYLTDAVLLIMIVLIIGTGILISTWTEIGFVNYRLVRSMHILTSIVSLLLLIIKLSFHWKWFANVFRSIHPLRIQPLPAASVAITVQDKKPYTRRDAIKAIGIISAAGVFALFKAASAMKLPETTASLQAPGANTETYSGTSIPEQQTELTDNEQGEGQKKRRNRGAPSSDDQTEQSPVINQAESTMDYQQGFQQPVDSPSPQDCVIRCSESCTYPGLCRRYIDENGNNLCDLGECLPV
ncbi:MAG: cytochrome b/b6 domain-containing protein [Anaerolineaceae bacterium]|nr:cytochrome b/b6 domain-containing protein [Anaerolineaceae bacterium]